MGKNQVLAAQIRQSTRKAEGQIEIAYTGASTNGPSRVVAAPSVVTVWRQRITGNPFIQNAACRYGIQ